MHSENNELAKAWHELAKCLDSNTPLTEIAKLITRLATALNVTTLAVREATKQRDAEHNDVLVWEKTMFKVCGEDGPKSVADKFASLEAQRDALAAENAALKSKVRELLNEACGVYEKYNATINPENGDFMDGQTLHEFQFLMDVETPAIDAFLREVKAQGVEAFAAHCQKRRSEMMKIEPNEPAINQAIAATRRAGELALWFAAQLRKGGAA
ncbi:hypothetical protein AAAW41_003817 [Cronobacter sakazakii]